jgi:hypothetical protein
MRTDNIKIENTKEENKRVENRKEKGEILQEVREFLSLSRRLMRELDLLKSTNLPPEYARIIMEAVAKVADKSCLYVYGDTNERLM